MSNGFTPHEPSDEDIRLLLVPLDPIGPDVRTPHPSRERLEDIMTTPTTRPTSNRFRWIAVAAVAVVAVGIGGFALFGGSTPDTTATPPLELNLGDGGAMASCLPFDVEFLAQMPIAFEGTVTAIQGESVTLDVDHWYAGGDSSVVGLNAPAGMQALVGGIDFVEGGQYLVTASEGNVNYCGYSGPSTDEFRAAFDEAFGD